MPLTMRERLAVTRETAERYLRSGRAEKGRVLTELCAVTSYNRAYAARLLRAGPPEKDTRRTRRRAATYTADVIGPLRKVWAVLGFACGKRVAAVMPETVACLERFGELKLTDSVRERLLRISPATIDRALASDRRGFAPSRIPTTRPGTMLKHQIPVRTWAEWDDARCGFLEIDLVAHAGGSGAGEFCYTLDATDIASGWTETRVVRNRAQVHVFLALTDIIAALPFPVLGIDSDNGSEFINDQLLRFCEREQITFTRSRPGNKNDGCHVEQKNWSVVRRTVGYARFDTPEELALLVELYDLLRLHTNFFMPSARLIAKTRSGAKVSRRHDTPKTPLARVVASSEINDDGKAALTGHYETLNPAELMRRITTLQQRLDRFTTLKETTRRKGVQAPILEHILR
mgnify:CR=1 FL=1